MWSCVALPAPFDWLLADYFTTLYLRLKWYQFNSQIAQVFVQHFRLGLRMPILLPFSHHAACCMACCEVQMTIHTGSVGGYSLPLIYWENKIWKKRNTNTDTSSGSAGGDSLPLLLRKPGGKAILWAARLPRGELSQMIIKHGLVDYDFLFKQHSLLHCIDFHDRERLVIFTPRSGSPLALPSSFLLCCSHTLLRATSSSL